jgi:probable rRNA maturation factor
LKNLSVFDSYKVVDKKKIHSLVKEISNELKFSLINLEINFISSENIHQLNKTHLNHDYTTDIITFDYSDDFVQLDGEIFISVDDAETNSKKFKVNLKEELARLVIHGILHLLGFDDQSIIDKKNMKRMENKLLSSYKFILL